jgi:8-oxo-dGTP pyrophosphatase MutT (NUDIX family)
MATRLALALLLAAGLLSCVRYEYEHEFWLDVDGSGRVNVTGRPDLWAAFKGLSEVDEDALSRRARELLERSGLRVRKVHVTHRGGQAYLFVAGAFDDVNRLGGTPAFPDLRIALGTQDGRLRLQGSWQRPLSLAPAAARARDDGLMAVRFHLPSKIYQHESAADGVERGNILGWRQDVAAALRGEALAFGAVMDRRSIFYSTVGLFAGAVALGLALLGVMAYVVRRKGQRATASSPPA